MGDPLCAGCGAPSHCGPCDVDALHARIEALRNQLAAAITHPLAVASLEAAARFMVDPKSGALLDAVLAADRAWTDAGRPLRTTEVSNG